MLSKQRPLYLIKGANKGVLSKSILKLMELIGQESGKWY